MKHYEKYDTMGAFHWRLLDTDPHYRRRVEEILSRIHQNSVVVDIGCGDGAYMGLVAPRCKRVYGIDVNATAVRLAKEELGRHGVKNAEVLHASIEDADRRLSRGAFDVAYAMDVIEHLESPRTLLETAKNLLKPKAYFFVGTPLFRGFKNVSQFHFKEYTEAEIRKLIYGRFWCERVVGLPDRLADGTVDPSRFAVFYLRRKG